jgi:exopolyphosphatase/guanosine-5'-triphosphate,3'-diphosphate pyrophosphatase
MTGLKNVVNKRDGVPGKTDFGEVAIPSPTPVADAINPGKEVTGDLLAAVDLGSNSFHLMVARDVHGELLVTERQRETIRLAAGLDSDACLSEDAESRALACLEKFGQLLSKVPVGNVRVVGTNAMRRMRNSTAFIEKAEQALGHAIEVIAGREEARLIYLGVSHGYERGNDRRLVVDIGGGSTEVIVGKGPEPLHRESLQVGCVVSSSRHFGDGVLSATRFKLAEIEAELAIQPIVAMFRRNGWEHVIGCSGTIRALAWVMEQMGWARGDVTVEGLQKLHDYAVEAGDVARLQLPGLTEDRLPVFPGGLAIMRAIFELFDLRSMEVSDRALREGVIYDLLGRSGKADARVRAIESLMVRWGVDREHAMAVSSTVLHLYGQVSGEWDIQSEMFKNMLLWAAMIHEIGLQIGHDSFHKHGAYVIGNADLAGFARRDQGMLAALVRGHRRKFPLNEFEKLPSRSVTPAKRLGVLLRLSVLLNRARRGPAEVDVIANASGKTLCLQFPESWPDNHPLTMADLEQEKNFLKAAGFVLKFE